MSNTRPSLAILYPGDRVDRTQADPTASLFQKLIAAFAAAAGAAEPAIYHDSFHDQMLDQLFRVYGVLVWRDPVEEGRDRSQLDA